ncbi:hypothetical protein, partial [Bartonella sp. AP153HLJHH]|uniref:hypothetical protein n=1 Tax=Bartonella sp. AP153HLJHH TaxID=3243470 RepID=UPI0035D0E857
GTPAPAPSPWLATCGEGGAGNSTTLGAGDFDEFLKDGTRDDNPLRFGNEIEGSENQLLPIETSTPCKKKKALVVSAYKRVRFLNTLIICQTF